LLLDPFSYKRIFLDMVALRERSRRTAWQNWKHDYWLAECS